MGISGTGQNLTLNNLGIGDVCSTSSGSISVANMADESFLRELDNALSVDGV